MSKSNVFVLLILISIAGIFFGGVVPNWRQASAKSKSVIVLMEKCLDDEKSKGSGQDKINENYHICWMRAKTDVAK